MYVWIYVWVGSRVWVCAEAVCTRCTYEGVGFGCSVYSSTVHMHRAYAVCIRCAKPGLRYRVHICHIIIHICHIIIQQGVCSVHKACKALIAVAVQQT